MEDPNDIVAERIVRDLLGSGNSNSEININAGGMAVWIAATACIAMLVMLIVGGVIGALWMSREFARIDRQFTQADITLSERKEENDRMQTYLSAIYAQAPHLKPKEKSQERK